MYIVIMTLTKAGDDLMHFFVVELKKWPPKKKSYSTVSSSINSCNLSSRFTPAIQSRIFPYSSTTGWENGAQLKKPNDTAQKSLKKSPYCYLWEETHIHHVMILRSPTNYLPLFRHHAIYPIKLTP